jgi:hypothetical protein
MSEGGRNEPILKNLFLLIEGRKEGRSFLQKLTSRKKIFRFFHFSFPFFKFSTKDKENIVQRVLPPKARDFTPRPLPSSEKSLCRPGESVLITSDVESPQISSGDKGGARREGLTLNSS